MLVVRLTPFPPRTPISQGFRVIFPCRPPDRPPFRPSLRNLCRSRRSRPAVGSPGCVTDRRIGRLEVNRWNIPPWLEREVLARDTVCVYCGIDFSMPSSARGAKPSWEHIVNDERIINPENIARCCMSCNASKGAKELRQWLESNYCRRKGITASVVAAVVRQALSNPPMLSDPLLGPIPGTSETFAGAAENAPQ